MTIASSTLAVILAMSAATLMTRFGGLLLARFVTRGRTKRMLEAIPPAVLTAVVTPTALATGMAETVACAATVVAARRLSLLPSVLIGIVCVATLRAAGL
ncbi:MAG TPA: AzlD domain-containing protein [Pseudorhizobium sp.]|nr:AzlD domain-containing protein [Pseudorhizobium sp.]